MQTVYRIFLLAAATCAALFAGMLALGYVASTGPVLTLGMVSFAVGIRGTRLLRPFAFTAWIFAAVTAAMYYPQYFQTVGDFELQRLIVPLIQIIMFGMGTALSLRDFAGVVKMPQGVLVGVLCQFSIMPFVGFAIAATFAFPPEIAAGIILVGSAPSGVASNVMAYIAGANLSLSVTLTAVATLLSPIMTPLLMKLLAGQFVPVDFVSMMLGIMNMVILPVVLGLLFNHFFHGKVPWLDRAMPVVSMTGIAVVITIITAAGRDALLSVGALLVLAAVIHNFAGYSLGYWGCRLLRLDERSCRTIALEVGMQNAGMASGIAMQMGRVATVGLAPAVFGPWMNISGSALANWWRRKSLENEGADVAEAVPLSVSQESDAVSSLLNKP